MTWVEKGIALPFEDQPISGLFFLDGDLIAKANPALSWNKGHKYPVLVSPSGVICPLGEGSDDPTSPVVYLSEGDLAVPLKGSRDDAYTHVTEVAQQIGYTARKIGEDVLEVENDDHKRTHVIYDNAAQRITDVVSVPNDDAVFEALRRRERIDENENTIERTAALDRYGEELDRMEEAASIRQEQHPLHAALSPQVEHLLTLKNEIQARFRALPPEHQATIGLVLVKTIMGGEWGAWLTDALARTHLKGALFPSVDRDDLRAIHLTEDEIARLSDADLSTIAQRMRNHYINDVFPDELRFHAEEQLEPMGTENPVGETAPTIEGEFSSFATNSIAKEDLIYSRPDLKAEIEALPDGDVEKIAEKVGEALQEAYWTAVGIVLVHRFGLDTTDDLDIGPDE